jgi:Tfp pilus assembly protein FimV
VGLANLVASHASYPLGDAQAENELQRIINARRGATRSLKRAAALASFKSSVPSLSGSMTLKAGSSLLLPSQKQRRRRQQRLGRREAQPRKSHSAMSWCLLSSDDDQLHIPGDNYKSKDHRIKNSRRLQDGSWSGISNCRMGLLPAPPPARLVLLILVTGPAS